jgi:hypothetical protein
MNYYNIKNVSLLTYGIFIGGISMAGLATTFRLIKMEQYKLDIFFQNHSYLNFMKCVLNYGVSVLLGTFSFTLLLSSMTIIKDYIEILNV